MPLTPFEPDCHLIDASEQVVESPINARFETLVQNPQGDTEM